MILANDRRARAFQFERDTFAFPNELFWEYRLEAATGAMISFRSDPPPTYAHRCFVLVRAARQFLYHARFEPGGPAAGAQTYRQLVRQVISRSPRKPSAAADQIVIPGYDCLRAFSQAHEALLKAECGGAWRSYFVRSHWRMILPVWRGHQERMADQLVRALTAQPAPIVHVFRFPQLTINHAIVLFGCTETPGAVQFRAYDPNLPSHPTELTYRRSDRTFYFPRNHYWSGGKLNVLEVYRGWFY